MTASSSAWTTTFTVSPRPLRLAGRSVTTLIASVRLVSARLAQVSARRRWGNPVEAGVALFRAGQRLDDDEGLCEREVVGDGDVDLRRVPGRHQLLQPVRGAPGEAHGRLSRGQVDHPHIAP